MSTATGQERSSKGTPAKGAGQTRLNVNINEHTAKALQDYAEKHGTTVTEALRRLVGIGSIIVEAQEEKKDILLRKGSDVERIVFSY
jgi:hypothetical protein